MRTLERPPGIRRLQPSGRIVTEARPKPGWWRGVRSNGRARYAHLPRFITIYWASPEHLESRTRFAVLFWCGGGTPRGQWMADHGPLLPCLRCVGTREAAHLTGSPCAYACDLGCRP